MKATLLFLFSLTLGLQAGAAEFVCGKVVFNKTTKANYSDDHLFKIGDEEQVYYSNSIRLKKVKKYTVDLDTLEVSAGVKVKGKVDVNTRFTTKGEFRSAKIDIDMSKATRLNPRICVNLDTREDGTVSYESLLGRGSDDFASLQDALDNIIVK